MGAAFLCADLAITPEIREDHAAYIGHWLQVLKKDKHAIFSAAAHAQKAADYLNNLQPGAHQTAALNLPGRHSPPLPSSFALALYFRFLYVHICTHPKGRIYIRMKTRTEHDYYRHEL